MSTYYLINTFNKPKGRRGTIISAHRSYDAAKEANAKFQREVKAANGPASYMPTEIVEHPKVAASQKYL